MTNREQKQNDILAQCIHDDSSGELNHDEERIRYAERQEHCVRRAMWLMALLAAFAALALGYSVILLYELPSYQTQLINHVIIVVGLASLTSLLAFAGFWILCKHRLTARRDEERNFILKLLSDRDKKPSKNP